VTAGGGTLNGLVLAQEALQGQRRLSTTLHYSIVSCVKARGGGSIHSGHLICCLQSLTHTQTQACTHTHSYERTAMYM